MGLPRIEGPAPGARIQAGIEPTRVTTITARAAGGPIHVKFNQAFHLKNSGISFFLKG